MLSLNNEMTKEQFNNDKNLQNELNSRRNELLEELNNTIIDVSDCDFNANSTSLYLTSDGYIYKEEEKFETGKFNLEIIGYMNQENINKFMIYLLEEENVLERKNNNHIIYDYNVSITLNYNNNVFNIPDDMLCSNIKIFKYNKGFLSSRIIDKLYDLSKETTDLSPYHKRLKNKNELLHIRKIFEKYGEEDDDIPLFLRQENNNNSI